MKRDLIKCEGIVIYQRLSEGETTCREDIEDCKAPAIYLIKNGKKYCASHARILFTQYAISEGFASRIYERNRDKSNPIYAFKNHGEEMP